MVVGDWWCRRWCSHRREQLCDVSEDVDVDVYSPLPPLRFPLPLVVINSTTSVIVVLVYSYLKADHRLTTEGFFFDFGARGPYSALIYLCIPRRICGEEVCSVFCQFVHSG